jgi:ribosomal protein L14
VLRTKGDSLFKIVSITTELPSEHRSGDVWSAVVFRYKNEIKMIEKDKKRAIDWYLPPTAVTW